MLNTVKAAIRVSLLAIMLIGGLLPAGMRSIHAQVELIVPAGAYAGVIEAAWEDHHTSELLVWVEVPEITELGPTTLRWFIAEIGPSFRPIMPTEYTVKGCLPDASALATHSPVVFDANLVKHDEGFAIDVFDTIDNCPQCFAESCRPGWQMQFSALFSYPYNNADQWFISFGTLLYAEPSGDYPPRFTGVGGLSRLPDETPEPAIECDHAGNCTLVNPLFPDGNTYAGALTLDNGNEAWLWLDLPDNATGTALARLFAIQLTSPRDLIAPSGIDADACPPQTGIIDHIPVIVDGVFAADGTFTTEFVWWICPYCVECVMNFSETLQISAVPDGDGWKVEVVLTRYLQERPDDTEVIYQGSGRLSPVEPGMPDPVYRCDADGLCRFDFPQTE